METPKTKRKDRVRSHIPFRLNLLFFIIFLLFVALILRTGFLQIIKGEEFQAEVGRTESTIITGNVPRGGIVDANHQLIVGNEAKKTIMYTRGTSNTKVENIAETARKLAELIDIPHTSPFEEDDSDLTMRDLKDYFYATNKELMEERINTYVSENDISLTKFSYNDSLELINEAELMNFSEIDLKAAAIFTKMNSAYTLSTVNIKNQDVTEDEVARVSEYSSMLPGISTGHDWDRIYPRGDVLRSVLGGVSSEEQGLPASDVNSYRAKGYSRNDRVGTSYIEAVYEEVLRGSKSKAKTETNNNGDIVNSEKIYDGNSGNNLVLTIDMDFQEDVDEIVLDVLGKRRGLNESVYAVAMNPKNGDILAMSGKRVNEKGEVVDDALGVISSGFSMGSSIKPATILAGYMDGVITVDNNTIIDTPLDIPGTQLITSLFNPSGSRPMNDITALEYSSNIYMSILAMRMGGFYNFQQRQPVGIDPEATANKMRQYYRQFGLGTQTGIILNESIGQLGPNPDPGLVMFLSFGQFDTYTPLQLAQFSATMANGGTRFAPRLVSEIRGTDPESGEVGELIQEIPPKIMNYIDVTDEQMERVQYGMRRVINGNYGYGPVAFEGAPYAAAGKTGTAEAFYYSNEENKKQFNGTSVTNMTFVGYAPYEDPEIAIAVTIPYLPNNNKGYDHTLMSREIMDAYFKVGKYAEDSNASDDTEDE